MADYDLVIRGAHVYDGSGDEPRSMDVAVSGDRIAAVGRGLGTGAVEVDARGRSLAPGFIDVHSHDDFAALLEPELPFKLSQGVTTEIVGNCGMGAAPWAAALEWARSFEPNCELPSWEGHAGYLERLEGEPPSANVAVLAGHNTLRAEVLGADAARPASGREVARMEGLLDEALAAGALGLSTGLVYEPGRFAEPEEVEALVRRLGAGGIYTTHLRSEGAALLEAVEEALTVSERAGVSLQLSHHKASGRPHWGRTERSLARVDAARARGQRVWLDVYPYTASSTLLSAVIARGALGRGGSSERADEAPELLPEDVVLSSVPSWVDIEGKSLAGLAELWQLDATSAAERVLRREPRAWVVLHSMSESDVRAVLRHPCTMIGSDGIPQWSGRPHPRLYGTFPRVLGHYARQEAVLSLSLAIHKMTGLPAQRFGLEGRGRIAAGYFADLVVFDADRILDRATFEEPRRAPLGVHSVYVNGRAVVRDGQHLGTRPGRVLRRAG